MVLQEITSITQVGVPILSLLVFLPLAAAALIGALPDQRSARALALGVAAVELALTLWVLSLFVSGSPAIQFGESAAWMPSLGITYRLGVDGLSVLFLPLTTLVFGALMLTSGGVKSQPRWHLACLLALQSATLGMYCALDLILFFCFFEFALVPSFFLVKLWGVGPQRQHAAIKYLLYMLAGSVPLLVGFILLGANHADALQASGRAAVPSFDLPTLLATPIDASLQATVFVLLAIGFAVKGPAMPLHTWMPSVVMEGPIGMGVYLLGLKVGAYGFLRFVLPLAPDASREWAWLAVGLGLVAVIYGALIALVQMNLRRMLVFASVSHVGLIIVALFSLEAQGWHGALLLMLNAGLATAGLFLGAGFLHRRLGTTDLASLGGLARRVPRLACFFFVAGLALIGMPGTIGFAGELLAMAGAYRMQAAYGAIAALGVILGAGYFLWFYQRAFFGPVTNPAVAAIKDLDRNELVIAVTLMVLVFALGFAPKAVVDLSAGSIAAMTERVRVGALPPAPPVLLAAPGPRPAAGHDTRSR